MPIIDLRGLVPSAPPENPGFNRTRKLAQGSPYEQALAFEQQAADVRSGRGMAALQAMQNQQDQIAQQAQNIRLQQEAQIAAEQATRGLSGLDPMQPDYLGKRQQILQQSPSALLDPQFRNALNVYDDGYNNIAKQQEAIQSQTAAQQKRINDLAVRAIEFGADPNEVAAYAEAGDINRIAQTIGAMRTSGKSAGTTGKNPAIGALKDNFDLLTEERKQYLDDAQPVPPEIEQEYQNTRKQLFDARRSIYQPQQPAQAPAQGAPATKPVEVARPVEQPPPVTPPAVLEQELARIPVTQQAAWLEERKKQETELQRVNEAWTQAKQSLEDQLKEKYPDKPYPGLTTSPLEQLARQIVSGVTVADSTLPTAGETALTIPIADKVLLDLGKDIFGGKKAFTEPGSKRKVALGLLGSQDVTHGELIRDWANKYLDSRGLLLPKGQSPTGSTLSEQQQKDLAELKALAGSK